MRKCFGAALVVGLLGCGAASTSMAAVGIYYVYGGVDSSWSSSANTTGAPYYGNLVTPYQFGDKTNPSYLTGTFTIPYSVGQVASFDGMGTDPVPTTPGTWGASGQGTLVGTVSTSGFSVTGHAQGAAAGDATNNTFTSINGYGVSMFEMSFDVPAAGPDHVLTLNGSVGRTPGVEPLLIARLSEFSPTDTTTPSQVFFDYSDAHTFAGETFPLKAGYIYSLDLYGDALQGADAVDTGPHTATSDFDLAGTFTVVPEPTSAMVLLGASCLLAMRKRAPRSAVR